MLSEIMYIKLSASMRKQEKEQKKIYKATKVAQQNKRNLLSFSLIS